MRSAHIEPTWGEHNLDQEPLIALSNVGRTYRSIDVEHAEFGLIANLFSWKANNQEVTQDELLNSLHCNERQLYKLLKSLKDKNLLSINKVKIDTGTKIMHLNFAPIIDRVSRLSV